VKALTLFCKGCVARPHPQIMEQENVVALIEGARLQSQNRMHFFECALKVLGLRLRALPVERLPAPA
jgi:hypothetical protein